MKTFIDYVMEYQNKQNYIAIESQYSSFVNYNLPNNYLNINERKKLYNESSEDIKRFITKEKELRYGNIKELADLWKEFQDKKINKNNFFENTYAIFKTVKSRPDKKPDFVSESKYGVLSSEYWYTSDGVIRGSDHWGQGIRSCDWYLDNKLVPFVEKVDYTYAFCAWKDFVFKSYLDIDEAKNKLIIVGHHVN